MKAETPATFATKVARIRLALLSKGKSLSPDPCMYDNAREVLYQFHNCASPGHARQLFQRYADKISNLIPGTGCKSAATLRDQFTAILQSCNTLEA
jgi:hypothetical protein